MSRTIQLPGDRTAELISELSEWTPRRRRPIELLGSRIGSVLPALKSAGRILCEGDVIEDRTTQKNEDGSAQFPGPDVDLTERQLELLSRLNDAVAWGMLLSWTLEQPLPASPEDLLDECPADVYDALRRATAKEAVEKGGFDVDSGVEDQASPTGP